MNEFDEQEWREVKHADKEGMLRILARYGVRTYADIPLIALDADELRDVYAHVIVLSWKKSKNGPEYARYMRRIDAMRRTRWFP